MSLRPYQQECLQAIRDAREDGIHQQLVVLATGAGKTVIAANLPEFLGMRAGERMLFLCHRDELVRQTLDKFRRWNPSMRITVEKGPEHASMDADLTVASVQSLWRKRRLSKFGRDHFQYIVYDEAHGSYSRQNLAILEHFRALKDTPGYDPGRFLCGFTATPNRNDNNGLERIFQKITYSKSIRDLMQEGSRVGDRLLPWLCDIRAYQVHTAIGLDHVGTRNGDLDIGELSNTVNTPERNKLIVDTYEKLGEGMQAFVFTASVQHSLDLEKIFQDRGHNFRAVHGETPLDDRRGYMEQFGRRTCDGLISCSTLQEGVDQPTAAVALMARPTKSQLLFTQQVGRILRPYPAPEEYAAHTGWVKPYAVVVDFVENSSRHQLVSVPTLFGLRLDFDMQGRPALEVVQEVEEILEKHPDIPVQDAKSIKDLRHWISRVDLIKPPKTPREVSSVSKYPWLQVGVDTYSLGLMDGTSMRISQDGLGYWPVRHSHQGASTLKYYARSLPEALRLADAMVPTKDSQALNTSSYRMRMAPTLPQCRALYSRDKQAKATFPNVEALYRHAMDEFTSGNQEWNQGALSRMIDRATQAMPSWLREKIFRRRATVVLKDTNGQ